MATATGSGKTKCFLLPILDHCASLRADPTAVGKCGIKALLDDELTLLPTEWITALAERGLPLPTPGLDVLDAAGEAVHHPRAGLGRPTGGGGHRGGPAHRLAAGPGRLASGHHPG
ncbi:hypothetical protein [Billgrantia endophytica]|uniref:hypothetical protein n=1 Tax=Billgrantia endophytica TaxID=2033802 RepID=UPI0010550E29|nr:hypothetical protein [Halomonas endophytica]